VVIGADTVVAVAKVPLPYAQPTVPLLKPGTGLHLRPSLICLLYWPACEVGRIEEAHAPLAPEPLQGAGQLEILEKPAGPEAAVRGL